MYQRQHENSFGQYYMNLVYVWRVFVQTALFSWERTPWWKDLSACTANSLAMMIGVQFWTPFREMLGLCSPRVNSMMLKQKLENTKWVHLLEWVPLHPEWLWYQLDQQEWIHHKLHFSRYGQCQGSSLTSDFSFSLFQHRSILHYSLCRSWVCCSSHCGEAVKWPKWDFLCRNCWKQFSAECLFGARSI